MLEEFFEVGKIADGICEFDKRTERDLIRLLDAADRSIGNAQTLRKRFLRAFSPSALP